MYRWNAAAAAIQHAADEVCPDDGEQAGQLVMVVDQVFGKPMPSPPLSGVLTMLEKLQAGIAGQLAVLDDESLTGTGQSSSDVLSVPADALSEALTRHLQREILARGSGGGPLEPLAAQLNHDATHL